MLTMEQAKQILGGGGCVVDSGGNPIGQVARVFLDDQTGRPQWVTVRTGLFGGAESFVPLASGELVGSDVEVPFTRGQVKGAPRVRAREGRLVESEKTALFDYYEADRSGVNGDTSTTERDASAAAGRHRASGGDRQGPPRTS